MKIDDVNPFYEHAKETCIFFGQREIYSKNRGKTYLTCSALKKYYCRCDGECPFYKSKEEYEQYEEKLYWYEIPQLFIRRKADAKI